MLSYAENARCRVQGNKCPIEMDEEEADQKNGSTWMLPAACLLLSYRGN